LAANSLHQAIARLKLKLRKTISQSWATKACKAEAKGKAQRMLSTSNDTVHNNNIVNAQSVINNSNSDTLNVAKLSSTHLPDLASHTSTEPILAVPGQDVYISCVVKNLQNYTLIWRYSNDGKTGSGAFDTSASASGNNDQDVGVIISAGRQRVAADSRYSVVQGHDTWLLKITHVKLSDSGAYICQTNSSPKVKAVRLLSVIRPTGTNGQSSGGNLTATTGTGTSTDSDWSVSTSVKHLHEIDYDFGACCRNELVPLTCQRLCNFQQLSSNYASINIVHRCYTSLAQITHCMIGGRNHSDCCLKRHVPRECSAMCGQGGDISTMSVQDQYKCAGYSASIMSCIADGIDTLPTQPEMIVIEAVSSTRLRVSWQMINDNELNKIDGWIINLTKLSSFADSIAPSPTSGSTPRVTSTFSSPSPSSTVSTLSSKSLNDRAMMPKALANLTIVDVMNNSSLASMGQLLAATSGTISLKLPGNATEYDIDRLNSYTVYQIQMFSFNRYGVSQLSEPIRAVTLSPESDNMGSASGSEGDDQGDDREPKLPDTRKCCQDRGVTLSRCLDTLCDPVEADKASIADLMICAPWSNVTFGCLASGQNHTACCQRRGVTPFCQSMCAGDVRRVDYRHFRCLTHMSSYANCILESHHVLPAPPRNFTVGPITSTWAVLNWQPPPATHQMSRSIQGYRIFWRQVQGVPVNNITFTGAGTSGGVTGTNGNGTAPDGSLGADDSEAHVFLTAEAAINPYLLDGLQEESVYETFAASVNRYGESETSSRFIFQTLPDPEKLRQRQLAKSNNNDDDDDKDGDGAVNTPTTTAKVYNETECCVRGGVHDQCLGVCRYDMSVADVTMLNVDCTTQLPMILRCLAGNRNSVPCCRNRQVSDQCVNTCAGLTERSPLLLAHRCANDFAKIIGCMDAGARQIPGAPVDVHAIDVQAQQVTLKWAPAPEDALRNDIEYQVRYQELDSVPQSTASSDPVDQLIKLNVTLHPLDHNWIIRTNDTKLTLTRLRPKMRYSAYVTAQNAYGVSLPSLVLLVNTANDNNDNDDPHSTSTTVHASLSGPHSLEVVHQDTESIGLKWMAPLFVNADAQLKYRVYYKCVNTTVVTPTTSNMNSTIATADPAGQQQNNNNSVSTLSVNFESGVADKNWTMVETSDTQIVLRNLRYSSQYAIGVQALSQTRAGHVSELVLVWTAKPVPPTLNHPLVIGQPIEGNNITVMCVALGQPVPQISMFINGLLVQKRTQPYVIYHLVNLTRGQLTISCFASNGHGKDYASVQSRTELSVKFGTQVVARLKQVELYTQTTARLTCQVSGNPQPTLIWTYSAGPADQSSALSSANNSHTQSTADSTQRLLIANERVSTLLSSNYETPYTWSHTLIIKNTSLADAGFYQCKARNPLASASDTIQLLVVQPSSSPAPPSSPSPQSTTQQEQQSSSATTSINKNNNKPLEPTNDLAECCRSQNVSSECQSLCSIDGLDYDEFMKRPICHLEIDKLMFCGADGSDHRNCCRNKQVPLMCLRWCTGAGKLTMPGLCILMSMPEIVSCFQEGKPLLPGAPRNVRIVSLAQVRSGQFDYDNLKLVTERDHVNDSNPKALFVGWDKPLRNPKLTHFYRVFWRPFGTKELNRTFTIDRYVRLDHLDPTKMYEFIVKAGNNHGTSVYSDPLTITPDDMQRMREENEANLSASPTAWFLSSSLSSSSGAGSVMGRVLTAVGFASLLMLSILGVVMYLEKRGHLRRFPSSKSNQARISFANPTYMKDAGDGQGDVAVVPVVNGTSMDVFNSNANTN
ncbi:Ig-like and fibronectin type-III domain-containing protein 2, partial [Fragariocoptes setiger]